MAAGNASYHLPGGNQFARANRQTIVQRAALLPDAWEFRATNLTPEVQN